MLLFGVNVFSNILLLSFSVSFSFIVSKVKCVRFNLLYVWVLGICNLFFRRSELGLKILKELYNGWDGKPLPWFYKYPFLCFARALPDFLSQGTML